MASRSRTGLLAFLGMTGLLCIGARAPSDAATTQFYSWITPSGEMVLTDDPGQIPPARARGPVSVHSFQTTSPSSTIRSLPIPSPVVSLPTAEGPAIDDVDGAEPDSVDVQSGEADQSLGAIHDGLPFPVQMSVGTVPVYGFWSSRSVTKPHTALARHLRQLQRLFPARIRHRPIRETSGRNLTVRSQSIRDRQSLLGGLTVANPSPITRSAGLMPASHSRCCTTRQLHGGRRSASRR